MQKIIYPNGDIYFGEIKNNQRNGNGILIKKSKFVQIGAWQDNKPIKYTVIINRKTIFFKDFKKNYIYESPHNQKEFLVSFFQQKNEQFAGMFKYPQCILYGWINNNGNPLNSDKHIGFYQRVQNNQTQIGNFDENGELIGTGYRYNKEFSYFGETYKGKMNGIGVLEDLKQQIIYLGNFHNDKFGKFTIMFKNKNLIVRILDEGKNVGLIYYNNQNIYFGEIKIKKKKILRNGFGCYFFDGDDYYRGYWEDDQRCGVGQEVIFEKQYLRKTLKKGNQEKWTKVLNFLTQFVQKHQGFKIYETTTKPSFREKYEKQSNYFGQWYKNKKQGEGLLIQKEKQYSGNWSQNVFIKEINIGKMDFFIENREIQLMEESKKFIEMYFQQMVQQKKKFIDQLSKEINQFSQILKRKNQIFKINKCQITQRKFLFSNINEVRKIIFNNCQDIEIKKILIDPYLYMNLYNADKIPKTLYDKLMYSIEKKDQQDDYITFVKKFQNEMEQDKQEDIYGQQLQNFYKKYLIDSQVETPIKQILKEKNQKVKQQKEQNIKKPSKKLIPLIKQENINIQKEENNIEQKQDNQQHKQNGLLLSDSFFNGSKDEIQPIQEELKGFEEYQEIDQRFKKPEIKQIDSDEDDFIMDENDIESESEEVIIEEDDSDVQQVDEDKLFRDSNTKQKKNSKKIQNNPLLSGFESEQNDDQQNDQRFTFEDKIENFNQNPYSIKIQNDRNNEDIKIQEMDQFLSKEEEQILNQNNQNNFLSDDENIQPQIQTYSSTEQNQNQTYEQGDDLLLSNDDSFEEEVDKKKKKKSFKEYNDIINNITVDKQNQNGSLKKINSDSFNEFFDRNKEENVKQQNIVDSHHVQQIQQQKRQTFTENENHLLSEDEDDYFNQQDIQAINSKQVKSEMELMKEKKFTIEKKITEENILKEDPTELPQFRETMEKLTEYQPHFSSTFDFQKFMNTIEKEDEIDYLQKLSKFIEQEEPDQKQFLKFFIILYYFFFCKNFIKQNIYLQQYTIYINLIIVMQKILFFLTYFFWRIFLVIFFKGIYSLIIYHNQVMSRNFNFEKPLSSQNLSIEFQ